MQIRIAFIAAVLVLPSCERSEIERAADRYEFLKANRADADELCVESGRVMAAAADAGDQEQYRRWRVTNGADCAEAMVDRLERRASRN